MTVTIFTKDGTYFNKRKDRSATIYHDTIGLDASDTNNILLAKDFSFSTEFEENVPFAKLFINHQNEIDYAMIDEKKYRVTKINKLNQSEYRALVTPYK